MSAPPVASGRMAHQATTCWLGHLHVQLALRASTSASLRPQPQDATPALMVTSKMKQDSSRVRTVPQARRMQRAVLRRHVQIVPQASTVPQLHTHAHFAQWVELKTLRAAPTAKAAVLGSIWMYQARLQQPAKTVLLGMLRPRPIRGAAFHARLANSMLIRVATPRTRMLLPITARAVQQANIRTRLRRQPAKHAQTMALGTRLRAQKAPRVLDAPRASTQPLAPAVVNARATHRPTWLAMTANRAQLGMLSQQAPAGAGAARARRHRSLAKMGRANGVPLAGTSLLQAVLMWRVIARTVQQPSIVPRLHPTVKHVRMGIMASLVALAAPAPRVTLGLEALARAALADGMEAAQG